MEQLLQIQGCSLSSAQLVDRGAAWRDVAPAIVERVRTDRGLRLRFRHEKGVAQALRILVDAETDCCGWASWVLTDEDGFSVLEITGPPEGMEGLARAFGL